MTTFLFIVAAIGGYFGVRLWLKPRIDERPELKLMLGAGASVLAAWAIAKWAGYSAAGWTFGLMLGPVVVALVWQKAFGDGGGWGPNGDHVRGNALATAAQVKRMVRREESRFSIGEIPFPKRLETLHFLIVGATGSGKSQTFHQILGPVRESPDRAIIADVGGEFVAKYFRAGDVVFNPFDARGVVWSPLAEMRGEWDADKLARSIVPDGHGSSAEWNGYAQTLLSAVLLRLWDSGIGTNAELVRLLTRASASELKAYVAGLPAEGMFGEGSERMLASIQGILASYIKPLQHLPGNAGAEAFSLRSWMENEDGSWLFLNFTDSQFPSLKPLIAAVLDVSISALLELPPSNTRRVWFAIDEFASFGAISSIEPLLTKGRKFGAAAVLGLQSLSQNRDSYGREKAQTLLSCLGTWAVLRCSDAETAEYMSMYLGDEEIRREQISEGSNFDPMAMRKTTNRSVGVEYRQQRIVLASELQNLPNLAGLLNIAGDIPPCPVVIPVATTPAVAERFVQRERVKRLIDTPVAVSPAAAEGYSMPAPEEIEVEPEFDAAEACDEPPSGIDEGPIPDGLESGPEVATGTQRDAGYSPL